MLKYFKNLFSCELCDFNNPKVTATAVFIEDGKLLLTRRAVEPFKGMLDLPGGYAEDGESPEGTLMREVREELGTYGTPTYIGAFPGTATYHEKEYAILSHAFLVSRGKLSPPVFLNEEATDMEWVPLLNVGLGDVAFDSNRDIVDYLKENLRFDLDRVRELVRQLDPSAKVDEQRLYQAALCGRVVTVESDDGNLIGMGWIFPRTTMLRKQAVVEDMIVDEAYRGKGLGRKILDELLSWARKNDMDTVELTTNPKRIAANELYKKAGFVLHETNHYLYKVHD